MNDIYCGNNLLFDKISEIATWKSCDVRKKTREIDMYKLYASHNETIRGFYEER